MFPTTPILDDFNRPDTSSADPQWLNIDGTSFSNIGIQSNQGFNPLSPSKFAWANWTATAFGPDCEAYYTLANYAAEPNIRVGARFANPNSGAASGYLVNVSSAGVWSIIREVSLAPTTLATGLTRALSSGDKMGIQCIGPIITGWWIGSGGPQQTVSYDVTPDTPNFLGPGFVVAEFRDSLIEDFGGGNYVAPVPGPNPGRSIASRFA